MSPNGALRAIAAYNRQLQRDSQRRQRELQRQAKEAAKLSALEQARLEVETFENTLDVLLSIHKETPERWDWLSIAAALKPLPPQLETTFQLDAFHKSLTTNSRDAKSFNTSLEAARAADINIYENALKAHETLVAQIDSQQQLAQRILDGESLAFLEAFAEFNPVAEFSSAGSLRQFAVEQKDLINCVFKVDLEGTIPTEIKTLTASGKLTVKPMPKSRRHEIYQDYLSACALRMAREVFAMLPVQTIIVTALADDIADYSEQPDEIPILSVAFKRIGMVDIDVENISGFQAIDQFQHRCNFKVTRGSARFQPIVPFAPADVATSATEQLDLNRLLTLAKELQDEIRPAITIVRTVSKKADDLI